MAERRESDDASVPQVDCQIGCANTIQQSAAGPIFQSSETECIVFDDVSNTCFESCSVDVSNVADDNQSFCTELSKLKYVDIDIATSQNGDTVPVTCLEDSGTEIPLLRHSVIENRECNM